MSVYFIYDGLNEAGPFSIEHLKTQKLTRNTPIRKEGTSNWMPAEKLGELKGVVAPRKIKRPEDIVPAVVESVTNFKKRRPKTMYAALFGIALLMGTSIYLLGKGNRKDAVVGVISNPQHFSYSAPAPASPAADTAMKEAATANNVEAISNVKNDKEKAARLHWKKLFSATNSNYGIGLLGGIKDLKVIFTNRSDYHIEQAVAKLTYIKANGEIWKTAQVPIYGVPAHDSKEQPVPDISRCKKVLVSLYKVISKKMKFSYTEGQRIKNSQDPYYTE